MNYRLFTLRYTGNNGIAFNRPYYLPVLSASEYSTLTSSLQSDNYYNLFDNNYELTTEARQILNGTGVNNSNIVWLAKKRLPNDTKYDSILEALENIFKSFDNYLTYFEDMSVTGGTTEYPQRACTIKLSGNSQNITYSDICAIDQDYHEIGFSNSTGIGANTTNTIYGSIAQYDNSNTYINLHGLFYVEGKNNLSSVQIYQNIIVFSDVCESSFATLFYPIISDGSFIDPNDPYNGVDDSGTGGGDGTFDGSSDPVPVPSLPSIGATDTGFISLFVPSASQIRQVASYLWSNFFDLATFKKLFEDPMDCILGLSVVPVSVPTSGSAQITVGNVELSGISLPLASQQYVEIDCGTVDFTHRYFGSYLDFEPYTKMSLFVPYSGVHAVSADDIIGKVVGLKYHIDILTGSLVAFLTCGNSVLYEFNGACASNIPVNSMNYASTIENAIRIAVNIGTTVATAGAAAPLTGENIAARTAAKEFGTGVAVAGSTAEGSLSLKPSIDRAGSLGGTTGLMGNQIPYFIITRPRMCKPKNQDVFQGYPSFIQTTLGNMEGTGFTAFENVILAGSYLTDTEKAELESILKSGVYL